MKNFLVYALIFTFGCVMLSSGEVNSQIIQKQVPICTPTDVYQEQLKSKPMVLVDSRIIKNMHGPDSPVGVDVFVEVYFHQKSSYHIFATPMAGQLLGQTCEITTSVNFNSNKLLRKPLTEEQKQQQQDNRKVKDRKA